jgi:putative ABC transport system permease protein
MKFGQYFSEALTSLLSSKLRSGLTILGIVIGVASVIAMLAVGRGAQASINNSIQSIGTNLLFISSGAQGVTRASPLTSADANALVDPLNAPDVLAVAPLLNARSPIAYQGTTYNTSVVGTTPAYQTLESLTLTDGSFFSDAQMTTNASVVVLGSGAATNIFGTATDLVGKTIRIQNIPFKVIGVLASKGGSGLGSTDNNTYIPMTTAMSRLTRRGVANGVDQVIVQATQASTVNAAISEVTQILETRHNTTTADFTILNQSAILATATSITGVLTLFLGGIGGISLLVGGIGIMNIMFVVVTERTREIGLRKALGARKIDIMIQFLMESAVLSLLGGVIGLGLAWAIAQVITQVAANAGTPFTPLIGWDIVALAVLFSTAIGLFFGFYPSSRAANLEPVEALRSE